ncbi:MAG: dihydrofolate reductase family protein [Tannerella sp.]|nr:dihydrofolate reductase family protein [Tannerella sp.]
MRNEPGGDIWLFGGGKLISMLLSADLVNEMWITYIPVILGNGVSLFPKQDNESKWKLIEATPYNSDVLMVKYKKAEK